MESTIKCCICGKVFTGYGNDPWPVNKSDGAQCCDICNAEVVVPARIVASCTYNKGRRPKNAQND